MISLAVLCDHHILASLRLHCALIAFEHFNLSTTVYSLIMSIDNAVALIFLPLFGIFNRIESRAKWAVARL
jgi:hypothetical protein